MKIVLEVKGQAGNVGVELPVLPREGEHITINFPAHDSPRATYTVYQVTHSFSNKKGSTSDYGITVTMVPQHAGS